MTTFGSWAHAHSTSPARLSWRCRLALPCVLNLRRSPAGASASTIHRGTLVSRRMTRSELNNISQYSSKGHPGFSTAEAFAPWNYRKVVCLYPSIMDPRAEQTADGKSTSMVDHLVSYVRGATRLEGVKTDDDVSTPGELESDGT